MGVTRGFMGGVEVGADTSTIMGSGTGISAYSEEGAKAAVGIMEIPTTATIVGIAKSAFLASAYRSLGSSDFHVVEDDEYDAANRERAEERLDVLLDEIPDL